MTKAGKIKADISKLIICADDFAMHQAIDEAVLQLIRAGKLTATACMVLSPRWPQAATAINAEIRSKAAIGLHLDFSQFADAMPLSRLILRCYTGQIDAQWVSDRIHHQLDLFEQALGSAPDYIDGHQHVHQLPVIRTALLQAMQQRYAHHRYQMPWLRIAQPPLSWHFKSNIIALLGAATLKRMAKQAGIAYSPVLLGVYDFNRDATGYQQLLSQWLQQASRYPSAALMCHPGLARQTGATSANQSGSSCDNQTDDAIAAARAIEFSVLQQLDMAALCQAHHIQLSRQPSK